jgi:rhomboid protease GluP
VLDQQPIAVVKETLLSQRPRASAVWVALGTLGVVAYVALASWNGERQSFVATRDLVFGQGEYWRLLSTIGVHADLRHLGLNGAVLGVLVYMVHGHFGAVNYPILGLLLSGATMGLALRGYPPHTALIGASGMVYLLAAFWLTSFVLIERRLRPMNRFVRAAGFALITLLPTSFDPQVSYRTHALGFAIGAWWGVAHYIARRDEIRREEVVEFE